MSMKEYMGIFAISALLGGCGGPPQQEGLDQVQQKEGVWMGNNPDLLRAKIAGHLLLGIQIGYRTGYIVDDLGDSVTSVTGLIGTNIPVASLSAPAGSISITATGSPGTYNGARVIGAAFKFSYPNPNNSSSSINYTLKINDVANAGDFNYYTMRYQADNESTWHSLCLSSSGNEERVLAIPGRRWDPSRGSSVSDPNNVTLACESDAVGGCVVMGFHPWETASNGLPMADYHQACTRMKRADYCGTGQSFTTPGRPIWAFSSLASIPGAVSYTPEAVWGLSGPICIMAEWRAYLAGLNVSCSNNLSNIPLCYQYPGADYNNSPYGVGSNVAAVGDSGVSPCYSTANESPGSCTTAY